MLNTSPPICYVVVVATDVVVVDVIQQGYTTWLNPHAKKIHAMLYRTSLPQICSFIVPNFFQKSNCPPEIAVYFIA